MPRKKGIPNKTTADSKRVLVEILEGQSSNLDVALKEVFESDKRAYLHAMTKLLAFVLPKGSVHTIEHGTKTKPPSWFDTPEG
jgi:hypothetical protein